MGMHDVRWRVVEPITYPQSEPVARLPLVIRLAPHLDIGNLGERLSQFAVARGKNTVTNSGGSARHKTQQIEGQTRRHESVDYQRDRERVFSEVARPR
jgi:hypothetical protein